MISAEYIELITRHQVFVERYKANEVKAFIERLNALQDSLIAAINLDDNPTRRQVRQLLADLRRIESDFYKEYLDDMVGMLGAFGEEEARQESELLGSVYLTQDFEAKAASIEQVSRALRNNALYVQPNGGAILLDDLLKKYQKAETDRLNGVILSGYSQSQTTEEIIRRVRGTRANNYKDGIMEINARNAESVVRTAIQHASNTARQATWQQNQDFLIGYRIVATLDNRTSAICRSLDDKVFQIGKGPVPPFHYRCRTTTAPEVDEKFSFLKAGATRASQNGYVADQSYYEWLKTQPVAFQEDVLGPKRAKLLRDGGLSASRFAELQLDKNFQPLTLEELKARSPAAWAKAFNN